MNKKTKFFTLNFNYIMKANICYIYASAVVWHKSFVLFYVKSDCGSI